MKGRPSARAVDDLKESAFRFKTTSVPTLFEGIQLLQAPRVVCTEVEGKDFSRIHVHWNERVRWIGIMTAADVRGSLGYSSYLMFDISPVSNLDY